MAILIYENVKEMFNNSTLLCFIACLVAYILGARQKNYFRFVIYAERIIEEERLQWWLRVGNAQ